MRNILNHALLLGLVFIAGFADVPSANAFTPPPWYLVRSQAQLHVGGPVFAQFKIQILRDGAVSKAFRQKLVYSIQDGGLKSEITNLEDGSPSKVVLRQHRSLLRPDAKEALAYAWDGLWFAGSDGPVVQLLRAVGIAVDREGESHDGAAITRLARWEKAPVWRVSSGAQAQLDWDHDTRSPLHFQWESPIDGLVELKAEGKVSVKTWSVPRNVQIWIRGAQAFSVETERFEAGSGPLSGGSVGWIDAREDLSSETRTALEQYSRVGW